MGDRQEVRIIQLTPPSPIYYLTPSDMPTQTSETSDLGNEGSLNPPPTPPTPDNTVAGKDSEPTPWLCRPRVRVTIYFLLFLFVAFTVSWGIVPRLLDPDFQQHIQNKKVLVGMTRQQVLQAWGSPYQTNVTHTQEGIRREEWIYEEWKSSSDIRHRYLYFEEGILVGGWR